MNVDENSLYIIETPPLIRVGLLFSISREFYLVGFLFFLNQKLVFANFKKIKIFST